MVRDFNRKVIHSFMSDKKQDVKAFREQCKENLSSRERVKANAMALQRHKGAWREDYQD